MNITILNQIFDSFIIFKVGFLVLCLFHAVFLFIVYNQVRSMDRIVSEKSSSAVLKTVSLISVILAFRFLLRQLLYFKSMQGEPNILVAKIAATPSPPLGLKHIMQASYTQLFPSPVTPKRD